MSAITEKQQTSIDTNFIEFLDCIKEHNSTCEDWCWDKIIELAKLHKEFHDEILKGE
jgi:hypothetical protein